VKPEIKLSNMQTFTPYHTENIASALQWPVE